MTEAVFVWLAVLATIALIVLYLILCKRSDAARHVTPWRPGGVENRSDPTLSIPIRGRHRT